MRKSTDANKHEAKAFTFGIDSAPATRPWRENRLTCAPTETHVYVEEKGIAIHAGIHDVSRSGLRLVLEQPIAVGSAVKVVLAGLIVLGEIRYCNQARDGTFIAGMRIDAAQKVV